MFGWCVAITAPRAPALRPRRSATDPLEGLRVAFIKDRHFDFEVDIGVSSVGSTTRACPPMGLLAMDVRGTLRQSESPL